MLIGVNVCELLVMDKAQGRAARAHLRQTFLQTAGWQDASQVGLPGDASFRRYIRLNMAGQRAMLMDAPPPTEDIRPFTKIARHLRACGFSAPELLAEDDDNGFLILEDFGDDTFTNLLAQNGDENALYELATDTLAALHVLDKNKAVPKGLAPYDNDCLLTETALLLDWFMDAHDIDVSRDAKRAYDQAWIDLFDGVHRGQKTLVLRDYHVDNLMRLEGRDGIAACGLLDFQDARVGHPAYDLMSLLEDARRDVDPDLQVRMKDRYHAAVGTIDREQFDTAYAILAAQRHAKVIGIFTRLDRRDDKPHYLIHIDRLWRLFEQSMGHPALCSIKAWVNEHIPTDKRRAAKGCL